MPGEKSAGCDANRGGNARLAVMADSVADGRDKT